MSASSRARPYCADVGVAVHRQRVERDDPIVDARLPTLRTSWPTRGGSAPRRTRRRKCSTACSRARTARRARAVRTDRFASLARASTAREPCSNEPRHSSSAANGTSTSGTPANSSGRNSSRSSALPIVGCVNTSRTTRSLNRLKAVAESPAAKQVTRRRAGVARAQEMPCGRLVQSCLTNRVAGVQLGLQDFLDQLVVPVRAGVFVDDGDEQVGVEQVLEEARGSIAAHRLARRHRQLVEHGGRQHEVDDFLRLTVEDLFHEVAGNRLTVGPRLDAASSAGRATSASRSPSSAARPTNPRSAVGRLRHPDRRDRARTPRRSSSSRPPRTRGRRRGARPAAPVPSCDAAAAADRSVRRSRSAPSRGSTRRAARTRRALSLPTRWKSSIATIAPSTSPSRSSANAATASIETSPSTCSNSRAFSPSSARRSRVATPR